MMIIVLLKTQYAPIGRQSQVLEAPLGGEAEKLKVRVVPSGHERRSLEPL